MVGVAGRMVIEQLVGQAQNGGEDVVEIMRHAAGQLPHRLHAGDGSDLRLESQLLAHVAHGDQRADAQARRHRHDGDDLLVIGPGAQRGAHFDGRVLLDGGSDGRGDLRRRPRR